MIGEERRRDYRFAITLEGLLARGHVPIVVENVAYRGVLLMTGEPIVIGQLSQFRVLLPDEGLVSLHGVPVRAGPDWLGGARTLGVRLIGVEPRWERFIRDLHTASGRVIKVAADLTLDHPEGAS